MHSVVLLLCLFLAAGTLLYYWNYDFFQAFRDFILLIVAIPAAWLTNAFQKRNNFKQTLRHGANQQWDMTFLF